MKKLNETIRGHIYVIIGLVVVIGLVTLRHSCDRAEPVEESIIQEKVIEEIIDNPSVKPIPNPPSVEDLNAIKEAVAVYNATHTPSPFSSEDYPEVIIVDANGNVR